ncbi:AAWKG family protein [Streptomyces sp. NPDC046862]|uniref:AAWKG family protein n=1 Tax=Streptomyces sp. NPDC046862 TaxID=3154603 RepID=UPI0034570BC3
MSKNVPVATSDDDWWSRAVRVFTGVKIPERADLFDALIGNDGIPLMRLEFSDFDGEPSNAILDAVDAMSWRTENSGYRINNTDFVVPFYSGKHGPIGKADPPTKVVMKQARITMLGPMSLTEDELFVGGSWGSHLGKDFQNQPKDTQWNNVGVAHYSYGGGKALEQLLTTYKTPGFNWHGLTVNEDDAVDLESFGRAAEAVDRVARFFASGHEALKDWEFDLGTEEAAWKGMAAGVFRDMIHGITRNYESYSEQIPLEGLGSTYGNQLRRYQKDIYDAADRLHQVWNLWHGTEGNPLRHLHDVLLEVTNWIWDNNITKVRYVLGSTDGSSLDDHHKVKYKGFSADYKDFGLLEEKSTWKKIGEEAIKRWQQSVVDTLGTAGMQAVLDIQNTVNDQKLPEKIETKTTSLSQEFTQDQGEKEKADQEKKQDEAERKADERQADQEKKQDERQAEQDRKQDEAERKADERQADQEKKQDERQAEQDRKQDEAERKADERQAEQDRKQDEAQRKADEKQADQEKKADERQAEQDRKQDEAQQKADEKQAEQEQKQDEQEQKAEQKQAEQERKQAEKEAEQERKQDEQEQKAEQKQAEQEQKQEEQLKRQEEQQLAATNLARADREEQKKQQEKKEQEQEQKQAEQEQEAEQKQAEQERKQEELQKDQEQQRIQTESEFEAKQAEQEAEQEKKQQEAEAKQEQLQQEQEQKQAEQEQKAEQKQAEQEQKQEEKEKEAEQKQAAQEQKAEQKQAEQEARQEQLQKEQEAKQAEAEKRYEEQTQALGGGNGSAESPWPSGADLPGGSSLDTSGATTTLNPDQSVTMEFPDGTTRTFDPQSGDFTTVESDGSTDVGSLPAGESITNSDGSTTTLNRDGTLTTEFPDGSSSRIDPDTGTVTSRQPDGSTTTTEIESGQTLPSNLGGGQDLPSPSYGGGSDSPSGSYGSYDSGYEEALYDDTPYNDAPPGNGYDAESGSGSGLSGGMPGGMPMLPMGTSINGNVSGGSGGERVRAVMDDSSQPITRGGSRVNRSGQDQEEVAAQRGGMATAGGMPFAPPMGGMGGGQPQTESTDRERTAWLDEDEDVWGTDQGGAPAVIGR